MSNVTRRFVRDLLHHRGWSQADLGAALVPPAGSDTVRPWVAPVENPKHRAPRGDYVIQILAMLSADGVEIQEALRNAVIEYNAADVADNALS